MDQEKIRKKKRKTIYKHRKSRIGCSVIGFLFGGIAATGLLLLFCHAMIMTTLNSKLNSEYEMLQTITALYQNNLADDEETAYSVLDQSGHSYLLKDADGSVIRQQGADTCGSIGGYYQYTYGGILISFENEPSEICIYEDQNFKMLKALPDHCVTFDTTTLIRSMGRMTELEFEKDVLVNSRYKMLLLPVWIAVDTDNAQKLIYQTEISASFFDLVMLTTMLIALAVIALLLFIILLRNLISDLVAQHRIRNLLFTDIMTKGHNWTWFLIKGEALLHKSGKNRYAVADISFVKYRTFCVCHSLEEGEQLLSRIQQYFQGCIGKHELCAHNSEGNFAMLLRWTDEAELRKRLGGIIAGAENVEPTHTLAFHTGVDLIPEPVKHGFRTRTDADLEKEYNNACAACATLEQSDDSGTAFFDEELVAAQKWIDTVQQEQRSALENEEFIVYYQPKYDPKTDTLCGAEALIRWQSPKYGFVSPGRFIPIFEKNGFITEIDHYMIAHAARDQRRWLNAGYHCVPVSVNVSRAHFIESDLAEQIRDIVDAEGTPHELIEIELTESAFFDDKKALIHTIKRLKEYGFAVSMDDFGSGYSSLNSLKDMPLDILKLDAEFFRGDTAGTDRGAIVVKEAIRLAQKLDMRTVAEGVEAREQVDFLAQQGCDMIQGYYYAKPMPGNEFEQKMSAGEPPAPQTDE